MDPSPVPTTPPVEEDDEWGIPDHADTDLWLVFALDTDGFVIPSLEIGDPVQHNFDGPEVESPKLPPKAKKEENIYLGPHGAPPSRSKQLEHNNSAGRKQRFKQKLKEADRRTSETGRENKLENLRELVGDGKASVSMAKGSSRDWLDLHCHESQFEKWNPQ